MRNTFGVVALAAVIVSGGCATSGGPSGSTRSSNAALTRAEIAASGARTAYDAVYELRNAWLQSVDPPGPETVPVARVGDFVDPRCHWVAYINNQGVELPDLHRVEAGRVAEIRLVAVGRARPDGSLCERGKPALHVRLISSGAS